MDIIIKSKCQIVKKKDVHVLEGKDESVRDLKIGCTISLHEMLTLENTEETSY